MSVVEVENVIKKYPSFCLDSVSFALEKGRIAGFIGRNGAGKTTTIKSMLNLIHTDSGSVHYFGLPLSENEREIKERIGYSTGSISWFPHKKIKELTAVSKSFYSNWDEDSFRRYLDLFNLDEEKTPSELSEGMKVKCNLLLALSHKAEVLILDEPTSGLDPFSRDELVEVFKKLKSDGVTVFFSTHIISDIEKCADDIIYISGGRIKAAMNQDDFTAYYSLPGETLEDTFLRLERGDTNA